MTGLIFKTILLGFSLLGAASYSISAAAADGDPALAVPPTSAASAALEAASPTTPAASAPKAAASAPKAAASAASAAASAPATAALAAAGDASSNAAAAPIESAALSTKEFYNFSYAIRDLDGLLVQPDLTFEVNTAIWTTQLKVKGQPDQYVSDDENMYLEWGRRGDGGYDVITANKMKNRSVMTVFKDKKPVSHTIVGAQGAYTATEAFCEVLKTQTKSKDFEDLKTKAAMCSDFYARTDESKGGMTEHIQTHRSNLERMSKSPAKGMLESPAKAMIEKDRAEVISAAKGKLTGWAAFRWKISPTYGVPSVKPRAILSKTTTPDDISDRQIVSDIAEACGRLWSQPKASAKPAGTAAAPAAKTPKNTSR